MTDKQIIDEVDVSGCLFYQTNFEEDYDVKIKHYCSNWHNSCESNNNSNCYYKQLKRKEQECKQLKAENDKMKKQVCGLRPELKYIIDKTCCKYNIEAKTYHEKIVEIINNLDKLSKTLTEIKEIAEKQVKRSPDGETFARPEIKQILQKISECEAENE